MKNKALLFFGLTVLFVISFFSTTHIANVQQEAGALKSQASNKASAVCAPTAQLSVALAPNNPPSSVVVIGQTNTIFLSINFTNTGASAGCIMNINSLSFQRTGNSTDGDVSYAYLYDGNSRMSDAVLISNGIISFNSVTAPGFLVPVNPIRNLNLRVDISSTAVGGNTVGFNLTNFGAVDASTGAAVSVVPNTPTGNLMTISPPATLPYLYTLPTTSITSNSAVLNGSYTTNNPANVTLRFEWWAGINGGITPTVQLTQSSGNISETITNLLPNTTYRFALRGFDSTFGVNVASNPPSLTFTTPPLSDLIVQNLTWNGTGFSSQMGNSPVISSRSNPYVYFNATIKNNTSNSSIYIPAGTKFTLYQNSISPQNLIGQTTIGSNGAFYLSAYATKILQFTSTQTPNIRQNPETMFVIMQADTTNLVMESNETNNTLQKTLVIQ